MESVESWLRIKGTILHDELARACELRNVENVDNQSWNFRLGPMILDPSHKLTIIQEQRPSLKVLKILGSRSFKIDQQLYISTFPKFFSSES